ncbi:MAG: phosphoribosylanthranilate isomerase [Pseudomonadota bacterium]
MSETPKVKICGLTRSSDVQAAVAAGADYLGFNFFEKSPRFVSVDLANELTKLVPPTVVKVALVVDAENEQLDAIVAHLKFDMLQLHGSESVERVSEIKKRYGLPVIKVLGVADKNDLTKIAAYEEVADQILLDTKPPKDATRPGGNAISFDWNLISGRDWSVPWILAGGLKVDNVAEAIRVTGASQLDLASSVENAPGEKDAGLMEAFINAAKA